MGKKRKTRVVSVRRVARVLPPKEASCRGRSLCVCFTLCATCFAFSFLAIFVWRRVGAPPPQPHMPVFIRQRGVWKRRAIGWNIVAADRKGWLEGCTALAAAMLSPVGSSTFNTDCLHPVVFLDMFLESRGGTCEFRFQRVMCRGFETQPVHVFFEALDLRPRVWVMGKARLRRRPGYPILGRVWVMSRGWRKRSRHRKGWGIALVRGESHLGRKVSGSSNPRRTIVLEYI